MYLIKQVSEISGVSVRTLHHYDKIGLLSPQRHDNGYRYYSERDMSLLQTILFYRYLGFSLKEIKVLIKGSDDHLLIHFKRQLNLMQIEKAKILTLIETLQKTIVAQERKMNMATTERFKGFTYRDNQKYEQAALEMYGKEVIEKAVAKQKGKERESTDGLNEIFFAFSNNLSSGLAAIKPENVVLAKALHKHIRDYYFDCSIEVFSSIGYGYVKNQEFKANLDQFGAGTAQYICDAVQQYVAEARKN